MFLLNVPRNCVLGHKCGVIINTILCSNLFVIGVTQQGTIPYVSRCMGGRMSDKEIAEQSSLLNYLLPGKC